MTPAFSARRRADEFEALVSSNDSTPLTERDAHAFAALLAVVDDLRAVPEVTARSEFVGDLRERLMAAADTALVPAVDAARPPALDPAPLRTSPARRRLSVLLGSAALVGATATVAVAAQSALPGESLYPVKRGIESVQLQMVSGPDRGDAQLANAADRLSELEALSTKGEDARTATLASDTLQAFSEQADEGGELLLQAYAETDDRSLVEQVHEFNVTSMSRLTELEGSLPADTVEGLGSAARTLVDLDTRAASACAICSGGLTDLSVPRSLGVALGLVRPGQDVDKNATVRIGQEVDGIVVPDLEVPDVEVPESLGPDVVDAPTLPSSPTPSKKPGETLAKTTDTVKETVKGTGETVKDTVKDTVKGTTDTLDDVTKGLNGTLDGTVNGTQDTVEDVTDWLDLLGGATTGGNESGDTTPPRLPGTGDSGGLLP